MLLCKFRGSLSAKTDSGFCRDILQNDGVKGFYKGGACRILVLAPTYAIIQGIYFLGVAEKIFGLKKDIKVVK